MTYAELIHTHIITFRIYEYRRKMHRNSGRTLHERIATDLDVWHLLDKLPV